MQNVIKFLKKLYASVISTIRSFVSDDLAGAIAAFDKASRKLDRFIEKAHAELKALAEAKRNIQDSLEHKNVEIDRAYRISHRLNELTK